MTVIDDRGRLFGKFNLIDALIGLFVLILIPLAYGAFLLFRTPVPTIISIDPPEVVAATRGLNSNGTLTPATVRLEGTDFRPYLRARIGQIESPGFLVQSPALAEIKLPPTLAPGTYDIALYDAGSELVRRLSALTVRPPPFAPSAAVVLQVVGTFIGLSTVDADVIRVGLMAGPQVEVVAVRAAEADVRRVRVATPTGTAIVATPVKNTLQVSAILRVRCDMVDERCKVGEQFLVQEGMLTLSIDRGEPADRGVPAMVRPLSFWVEHVRPADAEVAFPAPPPPPPPPPPEPPPAFVQAVGTFIGLSKDDASFIRVGSKVGEFAEVIGVSAPEPGRRRVSVPGPAGTTYISTPVRDTVQVPAILRLRCQLANEQCIVGDVPLVTNAVMTLSVPKAPGATASSSSLIRKFSFVVGDVRPGNAVTAPPPETPPVMVQAVGTFVGVPKREAGSIRVGRKIGAFAEVMAVRAPEPGWRRVLLNNPSGATFVPTSVRNTVQVPAILRLRCQLANEQCMVGGVPLVTNAMMTLRADETEGAEGYSPSNPTNSFFFLVSEVRSADAETDFPTMMIGVATLRIRFLVHPEFIDLIKTGQVDIRDPQPVDGEQATVVAIEPGHQQVAARITFSHVPGGGFEVEQPLVAFIAALRVPVVMTRAGWEYKRRPVKLGATFVFETADSVMEGLIQSMTIETKRNVLAH